MHKAFLVKLYPNKTQQNYLDKNFGCARFVYNKMLEINMKVYNRRGKYVSKYEMQSLLPKLKKQYPWLKECDSNADTVMNFCTIQTCPYQTGKSGFVLIYLDR